MGAGLDDRAEWVAMAVKIAQPLLGALAARKLRATMPIEVGAGGKPENRRNFAHLEALGRTLAGISPWLELPADDSAEGRTRTQLADLGCRAIDAGTDPVSPDYFNFERGGQPLVDAAFLAHALLRAPGHLWQPLDARIKANVIAGMKKTRAIKPGNNNWLLFAAIVEAFLSHAGEKDIVVERIDRAITSHESWYIGDGVYGDGPSFHWDYYNSFVIQPMLIDVLETLSGVNPAWQKLKAPVLRRAQRYAAIQERLISPEGAFPPIGRSLAYRIGVFQLLGQMALRHELPKEISPAQVRCALSAVFRRMMNMPGTFDKDGWLTVGFAGHQSFIGETYICTGSAYLCCVGLLPLGLPPADPFWADAPREWTAQRLWSGGVAPIDHAI